MKSTIELLNRTLDETGLSQRALSARLGLSTPCLAVARRSGTLGPLVAGHLALLLNLDVERWMTVAVLESAPRSTAFDGLRRRLGVSPAMPA